MDGRPTWTDCDEAGDFVVPNVLSPRDLFFRSDNMDESVPHTLNGLQRGTLVMRGTVLPLAFIAQALNPIYIFFFYFTAQVFF